MIVGVSEAGGAVVVRLEGEARVMEVARLQMPFMRLVFFYPRGQGAAAVPACRGRKLSGTSFKLISRKSFSFKGMGHENGGTRPPVRRLAFRMHIS
jgi:hypothetical protein